MTTDNEPTTPTREDVAALRERILSRPGFSAPQVPQHVLDSGESTVEFGVWHYHPHAGWWRVASLHGTLEQAQAAAATHPITTATDSCCAATTVLRRVVHRYGWDHVSAPVSASVISGGQRDNTE